MVTGSEDAEDGPALSGAAEDAAAEVGAAAGVLVEGDAEHALVVSTSARARLNMDKRFFKQIPPKIDLYCFFGPYPLQYVTIRAALLLAF